MGRDAEDDALTYSVTPGTSLPPGVVLSSDGILSGSPSAPGQFNFSVDVSDGRGGQTTTRFILIVTDAVDGQGPIITHSDVATPTTRDALAATTLTGTVRDVAAGAKVSGVKRMFVQLRRVSDGFAYNGKAFTSNVTQGYYAATRTWNHNLSFLPALEPGDYILNILAQDNAGNYGATVVAVTIVASSERAAKIKAVAPSSVTLTMPEPTAGESGGGS